MRRILGVALLHRESPAERERGLSVLGHVRPVGRTYQFVLVCTARERAGCGDRDGANHYCVKPSTACSKQDTCGLSLWLLDCWSRHCSTVTWSKPRPRSSS